MFKFILRSVRGALKSYVFLFLCIWFHRITGVSGHYDSKRDITEFEKIELNFYDGKLQ